MGAQPCYALVTLGLSPDIPVASLTELYDGMLDLTEDCGIELVGGDIVSAPIVIIGLTVIGETSGEILRRDAGRPGDVLAVTGTLGASSGGLRLLESGRRRGDGFDRLLEAHLRPRPRVAEGTMLVRSGIRCGLDLSDGLLGDTSHICERSGVGAVIDLERLPIDQRLRDEFGDQATSLAMAGGEDYELLCAGSAEGIERAANAMAWLDTSLTVIGRLVEQPVQGPLVRLLDGNGQEVQPTSLSWDHFRA
jgi:thiamine-monophosphate kinase